MIPSPNLASVGLSPYFNHPTVPAKNSPKTLTALPVRVAHLQVAAGSGGVLAGAVGAADLLNLLAQALQGAVNLQVAVAENVSIISAEHAVGIGGLLLRLGNEAKVESTARSTWGTRRSGRSRRSLGEERGDWLDYFLNLRPSGGSVDLK